MKSAVRISGILFLLLEIPATAFAQLLPFRNYTSRDGLLSNYSLALCNDSHGYVWIGSNDGLTRYDGISFRNYTVADGLAFSRVTCLHESQKHPGVLWIGTNGGGISKLENGHFTTYRVGSTVWSNSIISLTEDYTGCIWAATAEGVFFLRDTSFVELRAGLPRTDNDVVLAAPDSSIWIITDVKIFSCSPQTRLMHVVPISAPGKSKFQACTVDRNGFIWLSTSAGEIFRINGEKVVETIKTGSAFHAFLAFGIDGAMWAAIDGGLLRISATGGGIANGRITRYTKENGLKDDVLVDGLIDKEGDLWLAYESSGLAKLSDYSVAIYPLGSVSYAPNNSTALTDPNNHIWVCTENGLMEYWNDVVQGWKSHRHDEVNKRSHSKLPRSLCVDQDHTLWMNLVDGTIRQYRIRSYANSPSRLMLLKQFLPGIQFPKAVAMFIFCDDNGLLWCSMGGNLGVFLLNPQKRKPFLRQYTTANGLPDNSVRAIYEDRHGNLWFGGYSDGLSMLSSDESLSGRFRLFTTAQGLPNDAIRAITEDSLGTLWVGTRYGGLAYFQDSLFHPVSLNNGLLSTAVWCMAPASQKRIWIGTQMGIQSLMPASHTFVSRQDWTGAPVYACGENALGNIWFVSTAGLSLYDATRDGNNVVAPPVHVTHFEVNGVAFPTSGTFELSSDQDNCSIEVAGISLRDEGGLRYEYRLLGTSNDHWRSPKKDRTFVFASLSPGTYTFMVRALNTSGVASSIPATIQFTIFPPFWKQWWFIGGTALCLVLIAVFIVRLRVGRLLAIERLRSGIATDLHDDIGSGLTRIAILSDVAYSQVESGRQRERPRGDESAEILGALEKVRTTARGLIETMSDVVWAIDPSHDSFERLVQRLRSFAYEICEGKNIKLRFRSTDEVTSAKMSSEGMRNVLLLTKEALTNIAKHSQGTMAEVSLDVVNRRLVVTIADDGKGFNPSDVRAGNGLANMRKRTQVSGASLEFRSEPDKGTHIVASFPLEG
jgi:ligand-binding sensor domain-containing protein/two-component sensor histidine kinase